MTKVTFSPHPYLLGFEQLDRLVERTAKSGNEGYPPFNIEQRGDASYRITLALAGFGEDDFSINLENNQLVIRGRQADDAEGRVFLHRGIGARQFQRSFVLADGFAVSGAHLENGLLHVDLARDEPATQRGEELAALLERDDEAEDDETSSSDGDAVALRIVYQLEALSALVRATNSSLETSLARNAELLAELKAA